MKAHRHLRISPVLLALGSIFSAAVPAGRAQESLVGLGKVLNNGVLTSSASPVGATIASSQIDTGSYQVTFSAPGAFAGTTASNYLVETTIDSVNPGDLNCNATVHSVAPDLLTVRVRVVDLEDATIPELAKATNSNFMFVVRRLDQIPNGVQFASRHLVAVGNVLGGGGLERGFAPDGISITTGLGNPGNYFIRLSKAGAFASDAHAHYVLILSPRNVGVPDIAVRGGSYNLISDDFAHFHVNTDDVQQAAASNSPVPTSSTFAFAIYNLVASDATGPPATTLLKALASVSGVNGSLVAGRTSFPTAALSSTRTPTGRYDVFIDSPGAFAGVDQSRFVATVTLNSGDAIDELAKARVYVENDNRLRVRVTTDDVEHNDDEDGIPDDVSFFVAVYDAAPTLRHDLRVGSSAAGAGARGAGVFNATAAGQTLSLPLLRRKLRSAYYHCVNAGSSLDDLRLRSGAVSKRLMTALFVITGPRRNITAAARTGSAVEYALHPGATISLQSTFRYRKLKKRPKASFLLRTQSGYQPANFDANRVNLRPR